MKIPRTPPAFPELLQELPPDRLAWVLSAVLSLPPHPEYLHWDQLIRRSPPAGLTHEEWWVGLKLGRQPFYKPISLRDRAGRPFQFLVVDPIPEQLHRIDLGAGGRVGVPEPITNPETRDQYSVSSLIEEAITSSQLEGATTTREVATEMLRSARPPRDRSEQMILNNFRTMQRVGTLKEAPLAPDLVFELHRLATDRTLNDPSAAGRFRREDERIIVGDEEDTVFHAPPAACELAERMAAMCDFANGETPPYFVHPVLRSILLHFWLAYDHPFVDGNGRTARTLFYWSMLRHGFGLFEYVSISSILRKAPAQYGRAFLYTETDDNDLTYFILHQIAVIRRALDELHQHIEQKAAALKALEQELRGMEWFNHRQRALISHALRHPHHRYTIEGHRRSHNVVYQTARVDLLNLAERGILEARKVGKAWHFTPRPDLEAKLTERA
jgi:Fic family protein